MKKFSLICGVILGIIMSLGYLFFKGEKKNPEFEQKKQEVEILKQTVGNLEVELDSLRARKPERVEVIKKLPAKERVVYIEKKLDEVDSTRVDSIVFSPDSTHITITTEDLSRVNGLLEEREILKEEVVILDSIITQKDLIIEKQDTIIAEQEKTIKRQKRKARRRKILGISAGSGIAALAILLSL